MKSVLDKYTQKELNGKDWTMNGKSTSIPQYNLQGVIAGLEVM